jgi:hypothetical protein
MKKSEFREVINASKEKTWEVLFNQYGDIHVHNPGIVASNYVGDATKGELNSVRHCKFSDKLSLDEVITEVEENKSFRVVVTNHNLPLLKQMSAAYELTSIGTDKTEVKMTSYNATSPVFMIHLVKGPMAKALRKHLFGLKYYIETGKTVNAENYKAVFKEYYYN